MIKGIIFDLGSTLIEFKGNWAEIARQGAEETAEWFFKQRHVKVNQASLVEAILDERQTALERAAETLKEARMSEVLRQALQRAGVSQWAEEMIELALRQFFAPEEAAHKTIPDAIDTLKTLRGQGFKVGILSNAPDDALIQRMVNLFGLRPWVSPAFSSAGVGWRKPSPKPFRLIAERWSLPPEQIVVVGDSLAADILGAKNAGMHSILAQMVANPANKHHPHIRPERLVTALVQVPLIIGEL